LVIKYDLNDKFLSSNVNELIEFYNEFSNRDDLISWMKGRPKSDGKIYVEENKIGNIVVIIPTKDVDSNYALQCRNVIYKGISQIFVESVKPRDTFFNYAHNVNKGIEYAMKMDPDWIILSNDDMVRVDPPEKLVSELSKFDPSRYDTLFTIPEGLYHSFHRMIATPNSLYSTVAKLHPNRLRKTRLELWKKFNLRYLDALDKGIVGIISKLLYSNKFRHILTGSFTILSRDFVNNISGKVFDDTFINGGEDSDLSLRLIFNGKYSKINYEITDLVGKSLGTGWERILRNVVNEVYLSYKIENGMIPFKYQI